MHKIWIMGGKLTKNCIAVSPFVGTFSIIPGTNVFQLVTASGGVRGVRSRRTGHVTLYLSLLAFDISRGELAVVLYTHRLACLSEVCGRQFAHHERMQGPENVRLQERTFVLAIGGHVRRSVVARAGERQRQKSRVASLKVSGADAADGSSGWPKMVYAVSTTGRVVNSSPASRLPNPSSYKVNCAATTQHAMRRKAGADRLFGLFFKLDIRRGKW